MRIVFMGRPEFAVPTLLEMSKSGSVPVAVYTGTPAQSGRRGLEIRKTPVHSTADSLGIPVFTPTSLRDVETQKQFKNQAADIALVIAYGLLLPIPVLEMPRLGCLNLHASLLPRWRLRSRKEKPILIGLTTQKLFATRFTDCHPGRAPFQGCRSRAGTNRSNFSALRSRLGPGSPALFLPSTCGSRVVTARWKFSNCSAPVDQ